MTTNPHPEPRLTADEFQRLREELHAHRAELDAGAKLADQAGNLTDARELLKRAAWVTFMLEKLYLIERAIHSRSGGTTEESMTANPHLEVIRNALQAYGNAPALMHLAELEAEVEQMKSDLMTRAEREFMRAREASECLWSDLLEHEWRNLDNLTYDSPEVQTLVEAFIQFHRGQKGLLKALANRVLGADGPDAP